MHAPKFVVKTNEGRKRSNYYRKNSGDCKEEVRYPVHLLVKGDPISIIDVPPEITQN